MDAWNFNAPVFQTFEEEQESMNTNDVDLLKVEQKTESAAQDVAEEPSTENMEVEEAEARPERATFRVLNKTPKSRHTSTPKEPMRSSPRLAAIAKSIKRSNAARGGSNHRRSLSEGSNITTQFTKVKKSNVSRKVAVVRPKLSETQSPMNLNLTKEDLNNLEETTKIKKALSSNRQRCSNVTKGPLKAGPIKTTKPAEFNFATDTRTRAKADEANDTLVDFARSLRSNINVNNEQPKGPTKVQPFKLHNSTKPKEVAQPFLSMAELNLKFHTKTPQRFRTKPLNSNMPVLENKRPKESGGVTHPKTPRLSTRSRARSVDYPTWEEIEKREFEEAQKHQFKAKPINKKILIEPDIKTHETTKIATVPEPFDITDTRNESTKISAKSLLASCQGLFPGSLNSIPHGGVSSTWEKKRTELKPFSFDSRDEHTMRKKEKKIQKVLEEEKKLAEFHAQPMPVLDTVKGLPPKKQPTPTKVQPFNLHSEVRGSAKQQQIQAEMEFLEKNEKEQRKFKAQPDTVLAKKPFIPEPSKKPLTDISGFSLNTDKRAEERHAFDLHLKEKEDMIQAEKRMMEERKQKEEEEKIRELRKQAVHKAQPVRHFTPVDIKHGLLPPTIPLSPKFSIDQRLKARALSKQDINTNTDTFTADTTATSTATADTTTTTNITADITNTSSTVHNEGDLDTTFTMEI